MIKFSDSSASVPLWNSLADGAGRELHDAIRDFYSLYSPELMTWLAELYDPTVGGFYYSRSARDNESVDWNGRSYELLPDAESTCQALGIIASSGITDGKPYTAILPEWMQSDIADYIWGMQDPDGYFYHKQWGKEIGLSRRGRDLAWCRSMLTAFGRDMRYPTIVSSDSQNKSTETLIPDHLSSREKFIEYLDSLDVKNKSYPAGNNLSAQSIQIKSLGLMDVCIDYLTERQNPETGLWHSEPGYYGVNGLMKISGVYNSAGRPMPHSREAAMSAIEAISSTEPIRAVVDLWNTWVAVGRITDNLRRLGGDDGAREADAITAELMQRAPAAIRQSREKLLPFRKECSSFSYLVDRSASHSQGMPVALPQTAEGDVNATMIGSTHMLGSIFSSLGLSNYSIPLFGRNERDEFLAVLEKNVKNVSFNLQND